MKKEKEEEKREDLSTVTQNLKSALVFLTLPASAATKSPTCTFSSMSFICLFWKSILSSSSLILYNEQREKVKINK